MPIISKVGSKSIRMRLFISHIYVVLILGAITMVYPFMIMFSTSVTNEVDANDYKLIPAYFYDGDQLMRKYLFEKYVYYTGRFGELLKVRYGLEKIGRYADISKEKLPNFKNEITKETFVARVKNWDDFKKSMPPEYTTVYFRHYWLEDVAKGGESVDIWRNYLRKKFNNSLKVYNEYYGESKLTWAGGGPLNAGSSSVVPPFNERVKEHAFFPVMTKLQQDWDDFRKKMHPRYVQVFSEDCEYRIFLLKIFGKIEKLNTAFGTNYKSFEEIECPLRVPSIPREAEVWTEFSRKKWHIGFIGIDGNHDKSFQEFLRDRYKAVDNYNKKCSENIKTFSDVQFPKSPPQKDILRRDWIEFIDTKIPVSQVEIRCEKYFYWEFLKKKYNDDINRVNTAYGTKYQSFNEIKPPIKEYDYYDLHTHYWKTKLGFIYENYIYVIKFILTNGRALFNTFFLVIVTVAMHLTLMPLAAFALSRYKMSYAHRILLFLLATMAFPAEVAMIPNFLLLKELNLLNTYWALILPGAVSGFGIFLLKGFFDSLPYELYESAIMDGASELKMFWNITLPLSRPILAVIALGAFTSAYGGFIWAFLICQEERMWTLMVFLYQFQQYNPQSVVMASLVVAALPTLLVFIFCQRIIMRGIIIPTFK